MQLDALVAVAHAIPALYRAEHPDERSRQLGADDFLPIFIYVLVNSRMERVVALTLVLETLCDPKKIMGEAGVSRPLPVGNASPCRTPDVLLAGVDEVRVGHEGGDAHGVIEEQATPGLSLRAAPEQGEACRDSTGGR